MMMPDLPNEHEMLTREQVTYTRYLDLTTDIGELELAAMDEDFVHRAAVARNPSTPQHILMKLATEDSYPLVIEDALDNLCCPITALIRAVASADRFTVEKAQTALFSTRYDDLLDFMTNPATDIADLHIALYAKDERVSDLAKKALNTERLTDWEAYKEEQGYTDIYETVDDIPEYWFGLLFGDGDPDED